MLNKILVDFAKHYNAVEEKVLNSNPLECKCSNPGYQAECRSCPAYLELVSKIQHEIYDIPHLQCTYSKDLLIKPSVYRPAYPITTINKMLDMYVEGLPIEQICKELQVNSSLILHHVNKRNLPKRVKKYDKEFIEKAINLYYELKSTYAVAKELGISPFVINSWLKKAGIPFYQQYTDEYKQQCIDLYHQLGNAAEVARQMGIPKTNVNRWLTKAGVKKIHLDAEAA